MEREIEREKSSGEKTEMEFLKKTEREREGRLNENIWEERERGGKMQRGEKVCQRKRLLF